MDTVGYLSTKQSSWQAHTLILNTGIGKSYMIGLQNTEPISSTTSYTFVRESVPHKDCDLLCLTTYKWPTRF